MMQAAAQHSVIDAGGPTVLPRDDVVGLGPLRRCHAVGEHAAHVPGHENFPLCEGEKPLRTADIQDCSVAIMQYFRDFSAAHLLVEQGQGYLSAVGGIDTPRSLAAVQIILCQ